jgi:Xaa-Pro aminopeptidase
MSGYEATGTARRTPGLDAQDHSAGIDMVRLRAHRYARVQAQLKARDIPACVLMNPINIRYATGSRNMQLWSLHTPARYVFIPAEGRAILFDFAGCEFMSAHIELLAEIRPARSWVYFSSGDRLEARAQLWADEIADLLRAHAGRDLRLAVDRLDILGARALERHGITLLQGQEALEHARKIKSAEEVACIGLAITACETGMARMREALKPGITENELWSLLHQANIALGGEWIESRLLASGGRTNPWFQECSDRIIRAGELVAFDANLIGPFGYLADISRTYVCGPGRPSAEQRRLYGMAVEEIAHNMALIRAGLSFRDFTERAWPVPEALRPRRTMSMLHGAGMVDEWPRIPQAYAFAESGYDGEFEAGMTVCVESYVGEEGGLEGVKLEQQVLVTETGVELLSTFPYEEALLG